MDLQQRTNIIILFSLILSCGKAKEATPPTTSGTDSTCNEMATVAAQNSSFTLVGNSNTYNEFETVADDFVKEKINPQIKATPIGSGIQVHGNTLIRDYQLSIEGTSLCSNDLAVYSRPKKQQLWLQGKVPKIDGLNTNVFKKIPSLVYPTEDYAVNAVFSELKLHGQIVAPKTIEQCIIFENNAFLPVRKVSFKVNGRPYTGLVTTSGYGLTTAAETVRGAAPAFFENAATTTGTGTVAVTGNPTLLTGSSSYVYQTKSVQLTGLSAGGSLCSKEFVALSQTGTATSTILNPPPSSLTESFDFDQTDWAFFATTAYWNASNHVNWLIQNGFIQKWPGPQVQIVLDLTDASDNSNNGINNNAAYVPNGNSLSDPPIIKLGNGDRTKLKNLWTDSDAVQHETGHHLVYTRLTNVNNSISVVIHEGYADGQVLLQNQSPCLCTTVCNPKSSVCISNSCLRTAANNFTMAAPDCPTDGSIPMPQCLPKEVHQRSQVISGMLWDVAQAIGPSNDGYNQALKIEIGSITYLTASSEYGDMLEAMIKADEDLGSKYQAILIKEMCARGFDTAKKADGTGSLMSQISVSYTCPDGSGTIPSGLTSAPATSGAYGLPTTATGGK